MARLDKFGNPIPIEKPTKKPKKSKFAADEPVPEKSEQRRKQNHINRNFGKSVEREVAKLTGGTRVPMSGAVKNSVHNLEGDVTIRTPDGKKTMFLLECKGQSPKENAKSFQIKVPVLKQAQEEADLQKAFAAVWYHLKGENYSEDWVMIPSQHFLRILEMMREVYDISLLRENDDDYNQNEGRRRDSGTD